LEQEKTKRTEGKFSVGFVCSVGSLQICSGKDQSRDAVGQLELVEIDDLPQRNIEELHITEQLGLVDGMDRFDSLDFHE
jgi:hypothetical protein